MNKKTVGFIFGSIVGAAAGVVAGVMLAPRSGAESRAMAADAVHVEVVDVDDETPEA